MCGRFALGIPKKQLAEALEVQVPENYDPRLNVAPGQEIHTLANMGGKRCWSTRWWGLVPHRAEEKKAGYTMINIRAETLFDKPSFGESVQHGRCLVPAQAFYEWQRLGHGKQPYAVGLLDNEVFCMAALSASWQDAKIGEVVDSVAILTCEANAVMSPLHERMPVIVPHEKWDQWLDPENIWPETLRDMLVPYQGNDMRAWLVSYAVNDPGHESEDLLDSISAPRQGRLL
ncbi:SOS response-associated peptidase [Pseudodesulfovibrio piezophilus]|uniref:Abasic site processing protein n=1 Tax=Pseudodesulfovibrio piezophilus (strain DSM 21447 / JCM 15486 / C1TLV30) TaxID=1322246 RepID=M1WK40_PSEP2|nr:SOS response-associated peptidase [Pseudodesulfovibrio piezophilus]CCH48936.1 conserved protein of unknown function [Pseudodesulfovibrio piezophilus C1TLV30]